MTEPREPPEDGWPVNEEPTVVSSRDTLVGAPTPTPPPGPAGPPPDRRVGAGMLLALAVLALAAIGIVVAWLLTRGDNAGPSATTTVVVTTARGTTASAHVAVPRLIGLKEQAAVLRLGQVGLRPKEVFRPTKKPKGVVVSQKPKEATSLARGGQVTLVIDSGAPQVKVPDVRGRSLADARAALDALGLDSVTTPVVENKPAGTVVDQGPKPGGKLAKGSTVTLSVVKSRPKAQPAPATTATTAPATTAPPQPQNATMPDVQGQTESAAAQSLFQAGILPSIVFVPGTDTLGTVVQQAKQAGAVVPFHSHAQINVSKGPGGNPPAQVPNAIGQTLQQAVATMNGVHLRLIYLKLPVSSRSRAGKVVQQTPLGGNQVPQNAQVLVYLGAFQR